MRELIIGVGNEYRGDDAVALHVIRSLHDRGLPSEQLVEATGDSATLIDLWADASAVIIVDAVVSGSPLGTIHWIDVLSNPLDPGLFCQSTHAFGVREALELGRLLGRLPGVLILCGIECSEFHVGQEMTSEAARAVRAATDRVERWIGARTPTTGETMAE